VRKLIRAATDAAQSDEVYALYYIRVADILREVTGWGAACKHIEDALALHLKTNPTSIGDAGGTLTSGAGGPLGHSVRLLSILPSQTGTALTPSAVPPVRYGHEPANKRQLSP